MKRYFSNGVSPLLLNAVVATYIMAVLNGGFWGHLSGIFPGQTVAALGLAGAVWGLTLFTLELLAPGPVQRPMAALLIVVAASASFYEAKFGVIIDREMVRTILETTVTESRHLLTLDMVTTIALTGVLPAVLVLKVPLRKRRLLHQLWRWPLGMALGFAVMLGFLYADYKTYSAVIRENKALMASYQPGATISAVFKYAKLEYGGIKTEVQPIASDIQRGPRLAQGKKPVVFVLFVGETTRAQNFGLGGGPRQTTPELAKRDLVYYADTTSCGTLTNVSVPCMFSPFDESSYSRTAYLSSENLVDAIAKAGFKVQWWDNNTGDQAVMRFHQWGRVQEEWAPEACQTGECTDAIFLPLIRKTLAEAKEDTLLVLHMIGSHGPAYYLRYLPQRAVFQPTCNTAEFADCTVEQIVNAYDNTIVEADYVLSQTIDILGQAQNVDTAMVYVSDHGESLGEGGLYLHGVPKFLAPEVQTKVPFLIWLGQSYQRRMGITHDCLRQRQSQPTSQDAVFHTVLGLLDLQTNVLDPQLNLAAGCRENG